jgi:MOSC domain-containing protein YiiM
MTSVASARALENLGLEGDRHAKPDSKRQVLLIETETLERFGLRVGEVKENITTRGIALMNLPMGTRLRVGEVKENITTRGITLMSLPVGTRLRVGDAILEITGVCHPCERMEELRPGLRETLNGQRGMLARVAQSGTLHVGDAILVETPST